MVFSNDEDPSSSVKSLTWEALSSAGAHARQQDETSLRVVIVEEAEEESSWNTEALRKSWSSLFDFLGCGRSVNASKNCSSSCFGLVEESEKKGVWCHHLACASSSAIHRRLELQSVESHAWHNGQHGTLSLLTVGFHVLVFTCLLLLLRQD